MEAVPRLAPLPLRAIDAISAIDAPAPCRSLEDDQRDDKDDETLHNMFLSARRLRRRAWGKKGGAQPHPPRLRAAALNNPA
jgi:CHAD domain-containing protein